MTESIELRSRRIKFSNDDRKYVPVLDFNGPDSQIILGVKNTTYEKGHKLFNQCIQLKNNDGTDKPIEIVDSTSIVDKKYDHFTVLAASSVVDLETHLGNLRFKQNF